MVQRKERKLQVCSMWNKILLRQKICRFTLGIATGLFIATVIIKFSWWKLLSLAILIGAYIFYSRKTDKILCKAVSGV